MSVRVEAGEGLYVLVASGEYGVDELAYAFEQLVLDVRRSALGPPPGLVLDVRDSESLLRRPPDETRRIIAHFRLHGGLFSSRVAIVVRGHARYGLMRMATTWAALAGYDARVFWDLAAAELWVRPTSVAASRPTG